METTDKYSRLYGAIRDVSLHTKPSTIKVSESLTGRTETFIVETCRHNDDGGSRGKTGGDYIFIEHISEAGVVRLALPPRVAQLIANQRDSLTKRRRSASSRATMRARMNAGEWKGFAKASHRGLQAVEEHRSA